MLVTIILIFIIIWLGLNLVTSTVELINLLRKKDRKDMKEMLKIQGNDGNWNYDGYMLGLYNGLEMMLATYERREPEFRSCKTEDFLCNKPSKGVPIEAEVKD